MNDCVRGREGGVIVDYGGGGSDAAVDGLQRLLLTLVTCQDHNRAKIHPMKRGGHYSKYGRGDHRRLVNNNQVILVNAMVDFVWERLVNGYAESTMKSIGGHVFVENGVVALGQKGYRSSY